MTPEEYLRARGWYGVFIYDDWRWTKDASHRITEAEAVALQLAEDRACYNFVRERSALRDGLLVEPEA